MLIGITTNEIYQITDDNGWSIKKNDDGSFDIFEGKHFMLNTYNFFEAIDFVKTLT